MKHARRILAFAITMFAVFLGFQNCSGYKPSEIAATTQSSSTTNLQSCIGTQCDSKPEQIMLKIAQLDFILLDHPDTSVAPSAACDSTNCFDVAGYCETADFSRHQISVWLQGRTGFSEKQSEAQCDSLGRFRILVKLPNNYDYSPHTLFVKMVAIKDSGEVIENPLQSHISQINVMTAQ